MTSRHHVLTGGGDSGQWERLLTIAAREDLIQRLDQEFDRELLERAMVRVRLRVAPHNWEAFRLTAIDGVEPREVARRLEMKIANVYAARSNIQRLLREEVDEPRTGRRLILRIHISITSQLGLIDERLCRARATGAVPGREH